MPYSYASLNTEEKQQLSKFTAGIIFIAATWSVADAISNVYVIDEIKEKFFSAKHSEGINTGNIISGSFALLTNISMAIALVYYARRKKINSFAPISFPGDISALISDEQDDSPQDSSHHHHHCSDTMQHYFAHIVGLWMPSFCLAAGAGFATFSGEELSILDQNHYLKTLPIAMTVAIFATLGDVALHNVFLTQGEHDHGNFLSSYYDVMFRKPYALYQNNKCKEAVITSWVKWGTFAAHVSELVFAIDIGLKVLIDKPIEYLTDNSTPKSILTIVSWILAISGAAIHCHSEAKVFDEIYEKQETIFSLKFTRLNEPEQRYIKIAFLLLTVMDALWHSLPEFLGLPETLIFPYIGNGQEAKILSFLGAGLSLSLPDFISNATLGAQAVEMFNYTPASQPLLNGPATIPPRPTSPSGSTHHHSPRIAEPQSPHQDSGNGLDTIPPARSSTGSLDHIFLHVDSPVTAGRYSFP